ncbi:Ubiquinone biosynthesis protein coq9, mitochondrial [Ascochyta lentis]
MSSTRLPSTLLGTLRTATSRTPHAWRHRCTYHSYDYAQPPPFPPAETKILSSAYAHVPAHGFTLDALQLGARDAGYLDASTNLFPRGAFELINYHLVTQRLALRDSVQFAETEKVDVSARVRSLTLARLRANEPVLHRWQEALATMAQPTLLPPSVHELSALADEILFLASDPSVDTAWYTKRATLSGIYAAAEVFMTQDRSRGFVETEQFLDGRLGEVQRVGGVLSAVGEWVGVNGRGAVNVLRSKGVRI